jgi:multicomponent Na+:H+ antiporter subunit E
VSSYFRIVGLRIVSSVGDGASPQRARIALVRAAIFFTFWLMISGGNGILVAVGIVAVAIATWTSLRLLPVRGLRMQPLAAATLTMHILRHSAEAGIDVAWRAFDPLLSLRSGFVVFPSACQSAQRATLFALSSLQPGALPAGTDQNDRMVVHCLESGQPVVANMAVEEALFMRALKHD